MRSLVRGVVAAAACLLCLAALASAQTTTTTETKNFEVIEVNGNKVVLKGAEGAKEFTVPADFRFNVDGQMLPVTALKPGMKGSATITTSTTSKPVYVTEVKNGTVLKVAGGSVIVRTDEGIRSFTQGDIDRRNVEIIREGKPVQLTDLRVNDRLSATIVTEGAPQLLTERDVQASVSAPPATQVAQATAPPTTPAYSSAPATASSAPKTLPPTASPMPLLGLIGSASMAIGYALARRRSR